ncbi:hypothetical protein J6590_105800, partial [Homalodisca vitripennis]
MDAGLATPIQKDMNPSELEIAVDSLLKSNMDTFSPLSDVMEQDDRASSNMFKYKKPISRESTISYNSNKQYNQKHPTRYDNSTKRTTESSDILSL